ncbi:Hypothetical protein R9X50_00062900 [Acrodontium crateriforme]|uniref:RRM domain-containing protein n=1 Tax=Acrodontium crateriforme TaxID=150365 RepID=A0AAQ3M0L6_9PEZI|nr:Hypothetical protein R9X50_00062900 [Acrodontium crateriforme]
MNSDTASEPPDEPHLRSEPHLLSPASPKPITFPRPANIPVLEMQMDVGFNQTEIHISDPATRNTEVRPDFWRDPVEENQQIDATDEEPGLKTDMAPAESEAADYSNGTLSQPETSEIAPQMSEIPYRAELPAQIPSSNSNQPQPSPTDLIVSPAVTSMADQAIEQLQGASQMRPVDVQSLLKSLSNSTPNPPETANAAPSGDSMTVTTTLSSSQPPAPGTEDVPTVSALGLGEPPAGLPPRPPPQDQPLISPTYARSQIAETPNGYAKYHASPTSAINVQVPSLATLAYPPTAHTSTDPSREGRLDADKTIAPWDPEMQKWDIEVQKKYDRFIEEERNYVNEGRWDQFPVGSRLFVGNLSSEKVTKRDIYHVFHRYGDLAQISIKQAFGFVQFLRSEDCMQALNGEQGTQIREKRIHLEVSKPQKPRNSQQNNPGRRSRSPDYNRGGKPPANVDRYVSESGRNNGGRGARDHRRDGRRDGGRDGGRDRGRDRGHRNFRSPTPPSRDGHRGRYEDRYRTRSRSPGYGRDKRHRSPSPRRSEDDDLPLPRRGPRDVPDVQIIVLDNLDRDFIAWVERAFSSRNVRVDVLLLSPQLSEQAVIRRQIIEGVVAVTKLTRRNQDTGKIGLQIFDRSQGTANVKFEEYEGLDPSICVELVLRAKTTQATPTSYSNGSNTYGGPSSYAPPASQTYSNYNALPPQPSTGYGAPPSGYPPMPFGQQAPPFPPSATTTPPNVQNMISSLDPSGLQSLLSAMNQAPPTAPQVGGTGAPYAQQALSQQQQAAMQAFQNNPQALASFMQQQQRPQQTAGPTTGGVAPGAQPNAGGQVNMQDILARLGTYKQ